MPALLVFDTLSFKVEVLPLNRAWLTGRVRLGRRGHGQPPEETR